MPSLNLAPAWSLLSAFGHSPLRPLHTLVRTAEERFRPARATLHRPAVVRAQAPLLAAAGDRLPPLAAIHRETGSGSVPTIVLGGFVPDPAEQVFLLRRFLLKSGDLYCVGYPRHDFSADLLFAQLDDLVAELAAAGTPPVVFGVSFGGGLLLEWLRRSRLAGSSPALAGLVLISPVTCLADLLAPGGAKPATLLGRAIAPYFDGRTADRSETVEKSRAIFARMFEAGARNRTALRLLMSPGEFARLKTRVLDTIQGISPAGARARVAALRALPAPTEYFSPALLPLSSAPALVLFAEEEGAVLDAAAPGRFVLEHALPAYFPAGRTHCVRARPGLAPVQHASLVFHVFEFLPALQRFYTAARRRPLPLAA